MAKAFGLAAKFHYQSFDCNDQVALVVDEEFDAAGFHRDFDAEELAVDED